MKRITFRTDDNRAKFTVTGNKIYCSTQATADIIAKYEEMLESFGVVFEDNSADVQKVLKVEEEVQKEWNDKYRVKRG